MKSPIVCLHCHQQYQNLPEDTIVHLFTEEYWLSWFCSTCTHCSETNKFFCSEEHLAALIEEGCRLITAEYATDELAEGFARAFKSQPIRLHQLDEQERLILAFFNHLLDVCDIVAETVNTVPDLHLQRTHAA